MESDSANPQFDSFLGGNQSVPSGLNLSEFIKHRMEEVVMLTEAIEESPFRGQAFQRLPKHMRRRQMSHYVKRLPRKLQRPYIMSLKDGPPAPTKRPSRKYRRRPGNLLLEYNRRQKHSIWLETHIWHAKRFHMTTKWGYKIPKKPVNKSFKACYTAISEHCLLIDKSYYNCIELKGPEGVLLENLSLCTSPDCGLTFGAKTYVAGTREGAIALFQPNSYPYKVIGNVKFMWQPVNNLNSWRKIWVWVHPLLHDEVVNCFKLLFDLSEVSGEPVEGDVCVEGECLKVEPKLKKGKKTRRKKIEQIKLEPKNVPFNRTPKYVNKSESVTMTLLKDTLNRFQLTGPLSQAVVSHAFTVASVGVDDSEVEFPDVEIKKRKIDRELKEELKEKSEIKRNWWEEYYKNEDFAKNWIDQKNLKLSGWSKPNDMPSGIILGLVIEDPRMRIPGKREKAAIKITDPLQIPETSVSPSLSQSPIWIPEVRDEVSLTKLTTQEINEARSKKIVPGFDLDGVIPDNKQSRIPILLVQTPGNRNPQYGKLGLGSGWDVISPAGFGMPIWLSLIFRGARPGGLEETDLFRVECCDLSGYLPPDSAGGETENLQNLETLKSRYFKLPPNKRANFAKLGVASPFYLPWRALVRDWILNTEPDTENLELEKVRFRVLRCKDTIRELTEVAKKLGRGGGDYSKLLNSRSDCLVPVVIKYSGKGSPKDRALICVPEDKDLRNLTKSAPPVEPTHADGNETSRKLLKSQHSKLLKSLKRKRRKERGKLKEEFANNHPGKLKWKDILRSNSAPSEPHSIEYNAQMKSLWLPESGILDSVAGSSSRKILGFLVKGKFSYSMSRGLGLGYVTLPGLVEVFGVCERNKSTAVVLVRNNDQVQYRFGEIKILTE